jgi:hypothetical protein
VPTIEECGPAPRGAPGSPALLPPVSPRSAFWLVAAATLVGSSVFFVVTNAACWALWYPRTLTGLAVCYVAAIPFFRNTLLGDGLFTAVLFGALALGERLVPALRERPLGGISPATI